jgi:hypothetical protein
MAPDTKYVRTTAEVTVDFSNERLLINKDKQRTLINERLKIPTEGSAFSTILGF